MQSKTRLILLSSAIVLSLCTGCSTYYREHRQGYSFNDRENIAQVIDSIEIGKTDEITVLQKLGSPNLLQEIGDRTFLYIQIDYKKRPIFQPEITNAQILKIAFDRNHKVKSVVFDNQVKVSATKYLKEEIVVEGGKKPTVWQHFIDNIGRFNNSGKQL